MIVRLPNLSDRRFPLHLNIVHLSSFRRIYFNWPIKMRISCRKCNRQYSQSMDTDLINHGHLLCVITNQLYVKVSACTIF